MSKAKRTALVTGASGLAGGYMLAHLLEQGGWDVITVSRRKPRIPGDYRYIAVDLLDPADCQAKLGPLMNISHLFYLAITERTDPDETMSANANMFFNLVKTVEAASPLLEHVHLSQGTRWYGNHLGRCLCERLQGFGVASQLSGQARRIYRALPVYGRRSSGKGRRVDGDRSEMREPGFQHHQQ
jgi:hypothetical protein